MNPSKSTRRMGLAVLAGGLAFVGGADATEVIIDGNFENTTAASATVRVGGRQNPGVGQGWSIFSTYLYSTQYTFPGVANSGTQFLRPYPSGDYGIAQSSDVVTQLVSLTASSELTEAEIDAGFGQYNFSAWFSSYLTQGDFSTVTLEFLDEGVTIGDPIVIGGSEFVANIPVGSNGRYSDAKQWGQDSRTGPIPSFARTARITAAAGFPRSGSPDGYVDLVSLDVEDLSAQVPRVVGAAPANNSVNVGPVVNISVTLRDNVTAVNTNSIRLYVDNNLVAPTIQSSLPDTTVTYAAGLLPALSAHTYAIVFSDNGSPATTQSNLFHFTVADYMTLPTSQKSGLGSEDTSKPGFNMRVYQLELLPGGAQPNLPESLELSESALSGLLGTNIADLSLAVATNRFEVPGVINFTNSTGVVGNFTNDLPFPGIPGTNASENSFVHETLTYVRFPTAGWYEMGVNNDDQFRLSVGETPAVTLEIVSPNPRVLPAVAIATNIAKLQFGGSLPLTPLTGQVVYATSSGNPDDACALAGNPNLAGKIVLLDRGGLSCNDATKAEQAQLAGAIAVILITPGDPGFPMRLNDANPNIRIPVLVIAENYGGLDFRTEASFDPTLTVRIMADPSPRLMEWNAFKEFGAVDITTGFAISEPGIYPMRLLSGQGTGAASLEWFSILPNGTKILINDTSNSNALRAFRARTLASQPVFAPPTLVGGQVRLSWSGSGTLQEAPSLNGPWTTAASQTNPQNVTPAPGSMRFYRIRQP